MTGLFGYHGGLLQLMQDAEVPPLSYKKRAMVNFSVWHVGGPNRFRQYRPQHFVVPVLQRAVLGGATKVMCLVTESSSSGKVPKTDSGLVGDPACIEAYLAHVLASPSLRFGVYYRLLNPVVEVRSNTAESPCKAYLDFDLTVNTRTHIRLN